MDKSTKTVVIVDEMLPTSIPIISLRDRPYFPQMVNQVVINGAEQVKFVNSIADSPEPYLGFLLMKDVEDLLPEEPSSYMHNIGTVARIVQLNQVEDGERAYLFVKSLDRFEVDSFLKDDCVLRANVRYLPQISSEDISSHSEALKETISKLVMINPVIQQEVEHMLAIEDPFLLGNYTATLTTASGEQLQELLSSQDGKQQIEKALDLIQKEVEIGNVKRRITERIEERVNKQQKEFFLKQQLEEIRRELGLIVNEKEIELERFKSRIDGLELNELAGKKIQEEFDKIKVLETSGPEYHVSRSYLDWLTSMPWEKFTEDNLDLASAKKILDGDHYGLEMVKERILEFISVAKMKGGTQGSILLLVGPPGVGKTSIGRSTAKCLDRQFYRLSVGGMRDEAEIKGHRRTYIGALPGKFIQALKNAGSSNPVIMLDEIDKSGSNYNGDPASALLEALDPQQNNTFNDHYLDVPFDLSKVLFICTANQVETIPSVLLDRMEIIYLSGYIDSEKINIGRRFIIPRIQEEFGLAETKVRFAPGCLEEIIDGYAREAGMRSFEKKIRQIMRKITKKILMDGKSKEQMIKKTDLQNYLGTKCFREEEVYGRVLPAGVALGLAYTPMGGATMYIEAAKIFSRGGGFKQTGHLGNVMVESAQIAYSYIRSFLTPKLNGSNFFEDYLLHLHIPAGATPKDGPSAGLTMAIALYSLATDLVLPPDVAMTGEISLKGKIMPVGGIKEKTLAAKRSKIKRLLLPANNQSDFDSLDLSIKENITAHFVQEFEEVLDYCFNPNTTIGVA